jgi:hypothetical protein
MEKEEEEEGQTENLNTIVRRGKPMYVPVWIQRKSRISPDDSGSVSRNL